MNLPFVSVSVGVATAIIEPPESSLLKVIRSVELEYSATKEIKFVELSRRDKIV